MMAVSAAARFVPRIRDCADQGGKVRRSGDRGAFRGQIDIGYGHAGYRLQGPLHPCHTGGAGHTLDDDIYRTRWHIIARVLDCLDQSRSVQVRSDDFCPFRREVDGCSFDPGDRLKSALNAPDTGCAGHAFDVDHDLAEIRRGVMKGLYVHSGTPVSRYSAD